jgi:hypothetical protein
VNKRDSACVRLCERASGVGERYMYDDEEVDEQYEEWEVVEIILEKLQSQYHPGEWMIDVDEG